MRKLFLTAWAVSAASAIAPGSAMAQDQSEVLEQIVHLCSDPAMMPADWDGALTGWTRTEPDKASLARYTADTQFQQLYVRDGETFDSFRFMEVIEEHVFLVQNFPDELAYVEATLTDDDTDLRFYSHDSGWQLVLELSRSYAAQSGCMISHQAPEAGVLAHLERPYLSAAPFRVIGGRGLVVTSRVPDETGPAAFVDFGLFILDPAELPEEAMPQTHPARHASAVSLHVHLDAAARGARE
ncbi:MAG: hypothetical protein Q4G26_12215 [Paracoccus sp. (in: a-proteobacteria)]|nr:hypothetical protein [Paracoccus sp. (in: a-proteobacteria)]